MKQYNHTFENRYRARLRAKLIFMAILSLPLVFHLLLVAGGTLLYSAPPSAATSGGVPDLKRPN